MRKGKLCSLVVFVALLFSGMTFSVSTCFSQENLTPPETIIKFYRLSNSQKCNQAMKLLSPEFALKIKEESKGISEESRSCDSFCFLVTYGYSVIGLRVIGEVPMYDQNLQRGLVKVYFIVFLENGTAFKRSACLQRTDGVWEIILRPPQSRL